MSKKNVVIFFGGCSSEYSVSLESAYSVISAINRETYCPIPVGITKDGKWFYFGEVWTKSETIHGIWMNHAF